MDSSLVQPCLSQSSAPLNARGGIYLLIYKETLFTDPRERNENTMTSRYEMPTLEKHLQHVESSCCCNVSANQTSSCLNHQLTWPGGVSSLTMARFDWAHVRNVFPHAISKEHEQFLLFILHYLLTFRLIWLKCA